MGSRRGGFDVTIEGVEDVIAVLREIEDGYLKETNKKLRRYTRLLANTELIPALKLSAAYSDVPIAVAMADTARVKSDRIVVVKIGTTNPKLSGFKSGIGEGKARVRKHKISGTSITSSSQSYRTTLAFGSDRGPMGDINYYSVPRARSHWVMRTLGGPTAQRIEDKYRAFIYSALRKYGRNR